MQEKLNRLKKNSSKGDSDKFTKDIAAIVETLDETERDLHIKTIKQLEKAKSEMLKQYDKTLNLQHDVDRVCTKESFRRQFAPNESLVSSKCSPPAALDKSLTLNNEKSFAKLKGILGKTSESLVKKSNISKKWDINIELIFYRAISSKCNA